MADYKTYKKEKWTYFTLSIFALFAPIVIAIGCFFPFFEYAVGYKIAIGCVLVLLQASIFTAGVWANVRIHYPMLSPLPFLVIMLYGLFTIDFFQKFVMPLMLIEIVAACSMVISAVFWAKYRKYKKYQTSVKAVALSGMLTR